MTQNNMGNAYTQLPASSAAERIQNLDRAVACYQEVLEIWRKDQYPQFYGQTAANLGAALNEKQDTEARHWLKEAYALRELLPDQGKGVKRLLEQLYSE